MVADRDRVTPFSVSMTLWRRTDGRRSYVVMVDFQRTVAVLVASGLAGFSTAATRANFGIL